MADDRGWIDITAAPILSASAKAGLTGKEADMVSGYAWLAKTNKNLTTMSTQKAREEFSKLELPVQESLKSLFGDQDYSREDQNILQTTWGAVKDSGEWVIKNLENYGEIISRPARVAAVSTSLSDFFNSKTWDKVSDGRRVFDSIREQRVDAAYDPNVAKIAKRLSMGDTAGAILSDLETDAEFAAFDKFITGDKVFKNALRDYNDAKISPGRGFAHLLGLDPNVAEDDQGIEGKAYKMISGTVDLATTILTDPATYIAAPFKLVQSARVGVLSMLTAEKAMQGAGSLSRTQKALQATVGMKFGVDAAFNISKVAKAFDAAGPTIAKVGDKSISNAERAVAMRTAMQMLPTMDARAIKFMGESGVKDAATAREFFKNNEVAEAIMQGRVGSMQATLPVYSARNKVRAEFRRLGRASMGYEKAAVATAGKIDDNIINTLEQGGLITGVDTKKLRGSRDSLARTLDRALLKNAIAVEGDKVIDSAGSIFALARTFLPKPQAQMVANAFILAGDAAARRNIVSGLYDNLANHIGLLATPEAKKSYYKIMNNVKNAQYGSLINVDEKTARLLGVKAGLQDPSIINDVSHAVSRNQATDFMALPQLQKIVELQERGLLVRSVSGTLENRYVQAATDFWSALNLLPRLGLRGVLDETLFHALTMPLVVFPLVAKGYIAGIQQRIVAGGRERTTFQLGKLGQRDIGIGARVFSKWFVDADQAALEAAAKDRKVRGKFIQEQITKSRFGRLVMASKEDAKYIGDLATYGLDDASEGFASGMTAGFVNGMPDEKLFEIGAETVNINVTKALKELGGVMDDIPRMINYTEPEYAVNILMQLGFRIDRNGEVGKIAMRYIDRPKKAVNEIEKYFKNNPDEWRKFDSSRIAGRTERMDATQQYLHVRSLFVNDSGDLNTALINKVRRVDDKGNEVISADLSLDDIGDLAVANMLPRNVRGYGIKVRYHRGVPDIINELFEHGFQVADRQIATLTRLPVLNAYYLYYRRQMAGLEKSFVKNLLEKNPTMRQSTAESLAARRYAEMSHSMALNRTIGFIDNPEVRSNLAFKARNLARYYRANEDFFRRAMRVASNTPEALMRMRLASEGLDHAGFIHEDQNGDKYFFIPTDNIMYALSALPIRMFTGEWPKQPQPLALTGKIKMLTPSLDPESNLPALSGPLAAVSWAAISKMLPAIGGDAGTQVVGALEGKILGPYAEGQSFWNLITPMVIKRGLNIADALANDITNEQVASAYMKAAAMYSANPKYNMPDETSGVSDIRQAQYDIKATAMNIVFLRNLLGIFSPVAPSLQEGIDVPELMKDTGAVSFRVEFQNILEKEREKDPVRAYSNALDKYTRAFPGRLAYTVSESDMNTVGNIKKAKNAVEWIKKNTELTRLFPEGSVFLMPQMDEFDMSAYMFLKREGYIEKVPLEDYMERIATVQAENEYYDMRDAAETAASRAGTPDRARMIMNKYEQDRAKFLDERPYLRLAMERGRGQQLKINALENTREMLASGKAPENATTDAIRRMIAVYDEAKNSLDNTTSQTDSALSFKRNIRSSASQRMQEIAGSNPNAVEFYDAVLKRLIEN